MKKGLFENNFSFLNSGKFMRCLSSGNPGLKDIPLVET